MKVVMGIDAAWSERAPSADALRSLTAPAGGSFGLRLPNPRFVPVP